MGKGKMGLERIGEFEGAKNGPMSGSLIGKNIRRERSLQAAREEGNSEGLGGEKDVTPGTRKDWTTKENA